MNPKLEWIFALFPVRWQAGLPVRIMAFTAVPPNGSQGLIWPFLLASGRTPAVVALEEHKSQPTSRRS
jgi:hypothetical protein